MSHIVEIKTEVRDELAIDSACQLLKLEPPTRGTAELFSSNATGVIVNLPGWRYPAVFDTQSGQAGFDNYGGRWGEQSHLDRFLQAYAVEKALIESRKRGHTVTKQSQANGSIKLTVTVGGTV